jgi:SAM-dependent methyltransferase
MTTLSRTITIEAPAKAVFDVMKDPAALMGRGALGADVHDVTLTPDGLGTTFSWDTRVFGIHVAGTNEYTEVVPEQRLVMTASKGFVFVFSLEPDGDRTRLTLAEQDVAKNPAAAALDAVAMRVTAHDLDTWLTGLKAAVEGEDVPEGGHTGHQDTSPRAGSLLARLAGVPQKALTTIAWAAAGLPSGPIGWVTTRTIMEAPAMYRRLGEVLQVTPDDEVLDVACGSGAFLAQEAEGARRVAGVDLSEIQIGLARRKLAPRIAAGTADVVWGDAAQVPWPDGSFTAVTCMAAFEVFPDPGRVLAEMVRVLRPGGRVVLNIGERVEPETRTHRVLDTMWVWSEADVLELVERAGLADVSVIYVPWWSSPFEKLLSKVNGPFGKELRVVRATKPRAARGARARPRQARAATRAPGSATVKVAPG